MTAPLEHRSFDVAELRSSPDRRTVYGLAVPFGETIELPQYGYSERFVRGAFARTISERGNRVKLLASHSRNSFALGRATKLEERADGLHAEFLIARTEKGDEALRLIEDGALDSFSVGFVPMKSRTTSDGVVERTEVKLSEVSLVSIPAYEGAAIAGVRGMQNELPEVVTAAAARRRLNILEMKRCH